MTIDPDKRNVIFFLFIVLRGSSALFSLMETLTRWSHGDSCCCLLSISSFVCVASKINQKIFFSFVRLLLHQIHRKYWCIDTCGAFWKDKFFLWLTHTIAVTPCGLSWHGMVVYPISSRQTVFFVNLRMLWHHHKCCSLGGSVFYGVCIRGFVASKSPRKTVFLRSKINIFRSLFSMMWEVK